MGDFEALALAGVESQYEIPPLGSDETHPMSETDWGTVFAG